MSEEQTIAEEKNETSTFQGAEVTVNFTDLGACQIKLEVEINSEGCKSARKQAIKAINKEVSIPGFRKGKAPEAVISKNYSSYIDKEWKDSLLRKAFKESMQLVEKQPLSENSIKNSKVLECSLEEGAKVLLEYECGPLINDIDFANIKIEKIEKNEVKDERVQELLGELCSQYGSWDEVEDRVCQDGDFVEIDLEMLEDEPQKVFSNQRLKLDKEQMAVWVYELILGLKKEEQREGQSTEDERLSEKEKEDFAPKSYRVTLNKILEQNPAKLDEELFRKVNVKDEDELLSRLRERLEKEAEQEQKVKKVKLLEAWLLEEASFDLPASFVEQERRDKIKQRIEELKSQGQDAEAISSKEKEIEEEVAEEVKKSLSLFFLMRQLISKFSLKIEQDEIHNECVRYLTYRQINYKDLGEKEIEALKSNAYLTLQRQKVMDHLLSMLDK